jgi:dTDP-glucose 4,6-dehydratase
MNDGVLFVTGGAGFLGSHFVRQALRIRGCQVINVDALTYAGDLRRLADVQQQGGYRFVGADITRAEEVRALACEHRPDAIVHFAAESHVTRSESKPDTFFNTNVEGTRSLLEAAVWCGARRFIHISTDEVYGPILKGAFREQDKLPGTGSATSPYAQSKALADDLARSYADRLEVVVVRPTNAFGPWQYPEKAFARWITRALRGEPILVWGDGLYIRQWLYAEDLADAVLLLLDEGTAGETYNAGPVHEPEITNLSLARWIVSYLGLHPSTIQMTGYDRPDHDRRYAVDSAKLRALGWRPSEVWPQFAATADWYRQNSSWWESLIGEAESIYADSTAS